MDTWEYKTLKLHTKGFFGGKVDLAEFENELNSLGSAGWELISCFDTSMSQGASREIVCVFKRKR
ncbi:DUF4177 domain-containing protein [Paenibacillus albiflavus]|uniref:DUF4177 domain-containing protein n=1 Tax=Paenibacillus albiflavus TaxID=2545760 RepID=A0A4R4E737_9BACL|nr:DUF4177 domain-containing protein [Paenibacillus albiflavus]TCZ75349.1 DUF4177 domain-containing protein [Paenibacillus albiflavus]